MSISVVNNLELCYRGTVRHGRGGGGFGNSGVFLAHNYLSEQFGNYVEYGTPNKLPFETQGEHLRFYGVKHSNVWRSCQMTGPIGTNFGSRLRINLGMDIG